MALGLSIGITDWVCDERRGKGLRELMPLTPLIVYYWKQMLPGYYHGICERRNEPCFLPHIVQQVVQLCGEDASILAEKTAENARKLFRI